MIKILKFFLIIFFLASSNFVLGINRYFNWIDPKLTIRTRLDLDSYELYKETEIGFWESEGKVKLDPIIFNHLPAFLNNHFFVFENGNRIRITIDGTGQVYDFFPHKKELIRVDKTFHSGYNFGSNQFIRKSMLYGIGGEGFWNYSSAITFFDEKTKEWEILRPKNKGPLAIVDGYQGYSEKLDIFYSGASGINNYLEEVEKIDYLDNLFFFDFKQNKWILLGKINPDLPFKKSREIVWTGELFLHFSEGKIFIINPLKNKVYLYKDTKKQYRLGYSYHVNKDLIILFWAVNDGPVIKLRLSDLQKKSTYWGKFYNRDSYAIYYLIAALGGVIAMLFYFRKKKKSTKNIPLVYTESEKKLLLCLLKLGPDEYLTTHDLNDILETSLKTPENQRRIRFNIISELNKKLFIQYKVRNGIERISLPEDKRLIAYKLTNELKNQMKESMLSIGEL